MAFFTARQARVLTLSVIMLSIATLVYAGDLSLQQIVDLKAAGIGDQVVVHQIESSGLSFQPNAAALLSLRKSGVSDAILDAVAKAGVAKENGGPASAAASSAASDPISDLYKAKKYPEAADLVMGKVRANSASDRERAILVLALLKLDRLSEAKVQANLLAPQSPSSSYAPRLAAVLTQADEMQGLRGPIDDAIKRLSAKELQAVIESSGLGQSEKRDMLIDAAVLSADFDRARQLLRGAISDSFVVQNNTKSREQRLMVQEQDFQAALGNVDKFIYAAAAVSRCDAHNPDWGNPPWFTIPAYIDAVRKLSTLAPLDSVVLDRVFHATLITSKYQDLEELGDKILAAKGQLRLPGYTSDRFIVFVIDKESGRLLTELDGHPFTFNYAPASAEKAVAFNMPFESIAGLSQSAGGYFVLGHNDYILSDRAYAIKLKPSGAFFQYALMAFVHCSLGINAQQSATHNLGEYVQHVANIGPKSVFLQSPNDDPKAGGTGLATVIAGVGMALGVSQSSEFLKSVQANQSAIAGQQGRKSDLYSEGRFTFSISNSPPVQELEAALSLSADAQK